MAGTMKTSDARKVLRRITPPDGPSFLVTPSNSTPAAPKLFTIPPELRSQIYTDVASTQTSLAFRADLFDHADLASVIKAVLCTHPLGRTCRQLKAGFVPMSAVGGAAQVTLILPNFAVLELRACDAHLRNQVYKPLRGSIQRVRFVFHQDTHAITSL
jgi:hypothetical protein